MKISVQKLKRIEEAEQFLRNLGVGQVRVRDHGDTARIEVSREDMSLLTKENLRIKVIEKLNSLGYTYITLDLEEYRKGSMNKTLVEGDG